MPRAWYDRAGSARRSHRLVQQTGKWLVHVQRWDAMSPERILITGGTGQLGSALRDLYAEGAELTAPSRAELDLTDVLSARQVLQDVRPSLVIHAGAATDVDACETDPAQAFRVNALSTRHLAQLTTLHDIPLVYVSTNYVFDGTKGDPYFEWDATRPINVYGWSKLGGEQEVERHARRYTIVRTARLYGHGTGHRNFVRTMLRLAEDTASPLRVVSDQVAQPTYATDLAVAIRSLVATRGYGHYHLTNTGACSWYEWATEIFRLTGRDVAIEPIVGAEFPRPAAPPSNGVLANVAAASLGITLPDWRDGLRRCLASMGELPSEQHAGRSLVP